jgi:hypothetical protein
MRVSRLHVRVAEAALALCVAQLLLRVLSLRRIGRLAGMTPGTPAAPTLDRTAHPSGRAVARALGAAAARLPWTSNCLAQALAGRMMLSRRGVRSAVVLGVRRDEGAFLAHAWLAVADGTVCGGEQAAGYRPLAEWS